MADVNILIGAKGGDKLDGESGLEIRRNLSNQLANGIKIKVGLADGVASQLQAELDKIGQGLTLKVKNVQMPAGTQNSGGSSSHAPSRNTTRSSPVSETVGKTMEESFRAANQRAQELRGTTKEIQEALQNLGTAYNQFIYHRTDDSGAAYKKNLQEALTLVNKLCDGAERLQGRLSGSEVDALGSNLRAAEKSADSFVVKAQGLDEALKGARQAYDELVNALGTDQEKNKKTALDDEMSKVQALAKESRALSAEAKKQSFTPLSQAEFDTLHSGFRSVGVDVSKLTTQSDQLSQALTKLKRDWSNLSTHRGSDQEKALLQEYEQQLNLVKALVTEEKKRTSGTSNLTAKQLNSLNTSYEKLINSASQFSKTNSEIAAAMQKLAAAKLALNAAQGTPGETTAYTDYLTAASNMQAVVDKHKQIQSEAAKTASATSQAASMQSSFNEYVNNLSPKAWKEYGTQIEHIKSLLTQAQNATGEVAKRIQKDASDAIRKFKSEMKAAGYEGGNAFTYLEGKIKAFTTYFAAAQLSTGLISSITKAKDTVVDLNKAMTDLQIVTGDNDEQAEKLMKTYNGLARELGSTTASVASGAQDWLRQGYSLSETNELLKDSMSLSIMGNMDAEEATTSLTAALKGYQLQVDQASSVVDKFFAVDMAAATSSSKLAMALSKCAANAKLAGLSLNDVIGQLAVVNETMQEAGESTGTFYNTMLARMGNIKAGRLSDPETGEDLSDVETTLKGAGIQLRDSESEFRNFGDVLDEVAGKWNSFSDVTQRAIASAFAGSRQQTRFLALMQGYPQAAKYAETAANSIGVSAQKMEVYQDNVEAKANRMTAAFEKFSSAVISDDLVGFFYDLGAGALNTASSFDGLLVKIPLLIAAFATVKASLAGINKTEFGKSFVGTFKDLAGPKMTGSMRNHVAIISKAAA